MVGRLLVCCGELSGDRGSRLPTSLRGEIISRGDYVIDLKSI